MANVFTLQRPSGTTAKFGESLLVRSSYHNRGKYKLIAIDDIKITPIDIKGIAKDLPAIIKSALTGEQTFLSFDEIDWNHASSLSQSDLDDYAEKFNIKLDGRGTIVNMLNEFADKAGQSVEFDFGDDKDESEPEQDDEAPASDKMVEEELIADTIVDAPTDLTCPHCGTKARTPESFAKNHGDNCFKKA